TRRLLQLRGARAPLDWARGRRRARRRAAPHAHLHRGPGLRRAARRLGGGGGASMNDLTVPIGSLTLANPLIAASGCFGYGDEYVEVARILSDAEGVHALELNISCPNIKEGGITFGCSLPGTHAVVSAVRKVTRLPVIPKLTPNVTDVASFARAAEEAGADAVSLVNTFLAMAIDIHTRRPKLTNIVGGLSGPAIRPIAVRMVYECRRAVKIPIVGMGGIASADDVIEFMIAGA